MIIYKTAYFGMDSDEAKIEKLDLNKRGVITELNIAAEADNGHEIGQTQLSYFATKSEAEDWARRLILTRGNPWLTDEGLEGVDNG
tara:strand:+ start:396 stop:653 length:258 start_codon:yes stop_codon:yes gene_type:complete